MTGVSERSQQSSSLKDEGYSHSLYIPTDSSTGKLTGTRVHGSMSFEKEFDRASPYLYKAVATGQTLQSANIKWYRINDAGQEEEYFHILMSGVKIVSISPVMHNIKDPSYQHLNHLESVEIRYEKITWKYLDGNIIYSDSWKER
ncbi:Major exported protein [Photorhabdus australis subsp. thailandensis]|uniref:Major exported protein n=1 Tax=Photorhabdus australis subsp. thailandensis TaxID=2805096 RepID=A0A1C0U1S2_9GAMM|nr:type VI secretion system tube protein TssD [Photorhabdus australis]OCQ51869.1 Major exported protein [Photorhabdus australis subsp. thailandensis]